MCRLVGEPEGWRANVELARKHGVCVQVWLRAGWRAGECAADRRPRLQVTVWAVSERAGCERTCVGCECVGMGCGWAVSVRAAIMWGLAGVRADKRVSVRVTGGHGCKRVCGLRACLRAVSYECAGELRAHVLRVCGWAESVRVSCDYVGADCEHTGWLRACVASVLWGAGAQHR